MHSRRPEPPSSATQPSLFKFSLKELLTLPRRLCDPPPAAGKVRSCAVTPLYKVRLQDVLDRKHLPPLGLKDFEEWLLFVENAPENLYFVLWLREYAAHHRQWLADCKAKQVRSETFGFNWPSLDHNAALAMSYLRAKQTWFTANADYELNIASDIITPLHNISSPHPHPGAFEQISHEVHAMLSESLKRFVVASFSNVGSNRALCGICAGTFVTMCSVVLLAIFIIKGPSRWLRLSALPVLWFGLTILFAALNGVCLSIYVFGDVRQLRKFEFSDTPNSKSDDVSPVQGEKDGSRSIHPSQLFDVPRSQKIIITPPSPSNPVSSSIPPSSSSTQGHPIIVSESTPPSSRASIEISPEYYDDDPVEGPATGSPNVIASYMRSVPTRRPSDRVYRTAPFIHFYNGDPDVVSHRRCSDAEIGDASEDLQPVTTFDFDTLPPRPRRTSSVSIRSPSLQHSLPENPSPSPSLSSLPTTPVFTEFVVKRTHALPQEDKPPSFLARLQANCARKCNAVYLSFARPNHAQEKYSEEKKPRKPTNVDEGQITRRRYRFARAVPAFASPLTKVLSPVVRRAQWEVVVKSAVLAMLVSWIILGTLLAVPVVSK